MPMWGDKTHDWAAIEACVDIMYEVLSGMVVQAKEKFGYLRCYMGDMSGEGAEELYRQAYERCVAEYPHMAKYILMDADYPELLVGIVPEAECKHPGWWSGGGEWRCGVCMKVVTEDPIKKEEE